MKKKQVAVIIPIYNLWKEMTVPCLTSLAEHTQLDQIHIYLIDNASSDISAEEIINCGKNLFADKFTYHRFEKNKGFAIACNMGARLACDNGDEFIFLLNNDTLLTPNWLDPLLLAMEEPKIGAVGPLLLFPHTKRVQHAGVSMSPLGGMRHIYCDFPAQHPLVLKKRDLRYITGAAFLIKTDLFIELGMLCEEYVNGLEDMDLCCQIINKGYSLRIVPESIIYHYESQSIGRSDADNKNFEIYSSRHSTRVYDDPFIAKKDGYIPSLTKELQYYLALPREKSNQYTKSLVSYFSSQSCEKLLEKEPLWIEGYEMLAKHYDEQEMGHEACVMRERAVHFCPSVENIRRAVSSLLKYGRIERAKHFQDLADAITLKMNDAHSQEQLAKHFAKLAQSDAIYQGIYESCLQDI